MQKYINGKTQNIKKVKDNLRPNFIKLNVRPRPRIQKKLKTD